MEGLAAIRVITIIGALGVALYQSWYDFTAALSLTTYHKGTLQGLGQYYHTDFNYYVVAGIISVFFVLMFLMSTRRTGVIRDRNWVAVGGLTYPLYLIHANIGYMIFNLAYPTVNRHILLLGTIFIMIVFAYLVNQKVERRYSRSLQIILELAFTSIAMRLAKRGKSGQPYNKGIGKVQEGSYESRDAL